MGVIGVVAEKRGVRHHSPISSASMAHMPVKFPSKQNFVYVQHLCLCASWFDREYIGSAASAAVVQQKKLLPGANPVPDVLR